MDELPDRRRRGAEDALHRLDPEPPAWMSRLLDDLMSMEPGSPVEFRPPRRGIHIPSD